MRLILKEEDTRPRLYWFEDADTLKDIGSAFFMGDIERQITVAEQFGNEVINKEEYI
jgi:hypothetical protein